MNITLARTMLQERGYSLEMRDERKNGAPVCRVYANNGNEEHFLCTMSGFAYTSTKAFGYMIGRLPVMEGAPMHDPHTLTGERE